MVAEKSPSWISCYPQTQTVLQNLEKLCNKASLRVYLVCELVSTRIEYTISENILAQMFIDSFC